MSDFILLRKELNDRNSSMSIFRRTFKYSLSVLILASGFISCGGTGSTNDQGTSFLALGFFTLVDDEVVPSTQVITNPYTDRSTITSDNGIPSDGTATFRLIGVENRLSTQFLRVTRVDCSHDVQGSSLVVPDESVTKSFVLGPAEFDDANPANNGVPVGTEPNPTLVEEDATPLRPQVLFFNVPVVSTDISSFLNVNQNSLPELPFTMTTTCTVTGISQAGTTFTTNPVSISVLFVDAAECCTGTGLNGGGSFQEGTSVGGTLTTFGDPDATNADVTDVTNSTSDSSGTDSSGTTTGDDFIF